jgi:hypothetical protein
MEFTRGFGMNAPNMRRIIRTNRLLHELGHADVIEALEHMQRMRQALRIISTWAKFPPLDTRQIGLACRDALTTPPTPKDE